MKKVEMNGMYDPIFNRGTSPALPNVVTPKNPTITNIIRGARAFPVSSGRATVDPRKAERTTYMKIPRMIKKKVFKEMDCPIC